MAFRTISGVLASAVATGGTFTVAYPTGTSRGDFAYGVRHRLSALGRVFSAPEDVTIAFTGLATVTYNGATTLPAGTAFTLQLDTQGSGTDITDANSAVVVANGAELVLLKLGSPTALAAAGVCAAQAVAGAVNLVLVAGVNSPLTGLGARTGRNVTAVSANAGDTTQTITIRGFDMYNRPMTETFVLNGTTTRAGVKAFFRVTQVSSSAATAGNVSVGFGNAIGIPAHLPNGTFVIREIADNAVATSGTLVAGLALGTRSTATTADIRGTYTPNAAPDGSRDYTLLAALPDPTFLGSAQFV
jgi:hypothetical protein